MVVPFRQLVVLFIIIIIIIIIIVVVVVVVVLISLILHFVGRLLQSKDICYYFLLIIVISINAYLILMILHSLFIYEYIPAMRDLFFNLLLSSLNHVCWYCHCGPGGFRLNAWSSFNHIFLAFSEIGTYAISPGFLLINHFYLRLIRVFFSF